jgi:hypothetical protein
MKGSVKLPVFIDDARKYVNTTQLRAKYLGASYEAEYCQWQTLHGLRSLMETASLIITPNAYLEGKLIASYPPDPIGDFDVVRATTATRVNSAGLVELVPYNLLQYSEQFDNAVWTKSNATITANAITAPNGTLTADLIDYTGTGYAVCYQTLNLSAGVYKFSVYLKGVVGQRVRLYVEGSGTTTAGQSCFLTSEWVRYELSVTQTSQALTYFYLLFGEYVDPAERGDFYAWGAQVVEGSTAKDYQKTETRLNIPRLDYSNGTCPSLLVEPQRTNLLTYSSSFDNGAWTPQTISVSANATTSPDGTTTAETLTPSGSGAYDNRVYQTHSVTSGAVYTLSVWAKSSASNAKLTLGLQNHGGQVFSITNEWERYSVAVTALSTGGNFNIYAGDVTPTTGAVNSSNVVTIWGAQLEAGNYSTSYIPTTSASVTRNADVISKTGISSLIGQTEGVFFLDFYFDGVSSNFVLMQTFQNASQFNVNQIYLNSTKRLAFEVGPDAAILSPNSLTAGRYKIAGAYANNDFVLYLNGDLIGTDTSGSVISTDAITFNDYYALPDTYKQRMEINAAALWKTRLTNTQLAELTSL